MSDIKRFEHNPVPVEVLRETDRWLRRVAVYIPILAFVMGWGSGVITTFLIFKDHERRISILEANQKENVAAIATMAERQNRIMSLVEEKFKVNLH